MNDRRQFLKRLGALGLFAPLARFMPKDEPVPLWDDIASTEVKLPKTVLVEEPQAYTATTSTVYIRTYEHTDIGTN